MVDLPPLHTDEFLTHVRLTFAEPVGGPVLLGAGRYVGLGLLRPERDDG
jgi:CRISPR-associated protein Csb2